MVECIYLYRLCKFLCGDRCEVNSDKVQQRLFLDSSSALGLIRRTGTGRLKHIQIKQFFLQNLLRTGAFTVHKINTKINPGDLNTKRLGGERRSFLGRLIGLYQPNEDDRSDDNAIRQIKKLNRATKEHCVRLIQMAGLTMGMSMQLKGCGQANKEEDIINISNSSDDISDVQMLWHAPMLMGQRHRFFMVPSMWLAWWILKCEIVYLHARFREQNQQGDFMVDIEGVLHALDDYLTGGQTYIGASSALLEPEDPPAEAEPEEAGLAEIEPAGAEPFGPNDDIAEIAFQHARRLNGTRPHERDITMFAGETGADDEEPEDEEMDVEEAEESPSARRTRYMNSTMDEVSDPEAWAELHYGDRVWDDHERMVAVSRVNQRRLMNALYTLQYRRQGAEEAGNWEEVAALNQAIAEVENLRDIA
eukprot:s2072_g27.t1